LKNNVLEILLLGDIGEDFGPQDANRGFCRFQPPLGVTASLRQMSRMLRIRDSWNVLGYLGMSTLHRHGYVITNTKHTPMMLLMK